MALKGFKKFFHEKTLADNVQGEAAAPPYTCDGSGYKPYGVVRDKETGMFTITRKGQTRPKKLVSSRGDEKTSES